MSGVLSCDLKKLGGELTDGCLDIPIVFCIAVENNDRLKGQCSPGKVPELRDQGKLMFATAPTPDSIEAD